MSALDELNNKDNWGHYYQWQGDKSLQLEIVPELNEMFEALTAENAKLRTSLEKIDREGYWFLLEYIKKFDEIKRITTEALRETNEKDNQRDPA
jgi:hypothetical protein